MSVWPSSGTEALLRMSRIRSAMIMGSEFWADHGASCVCAVGDEDDVLVSLVVYLCKR